MGTGNEDALVCWNCGTLIVLRIKMVGGKRIVICGACGKTTSLD